VFNDRLTGATPLPSAKIRRTSRAMWRVDISSGIVGEEGDQRESGGISRSRTASAAKRGSSCLGLEVRGEIRPRVMPSA
jgi:hypothetical protein